MKKIYLLIFVFLPLFASTQREYSGQAGIYFSSDVPLRSQMPKMSPNFGAGALLSFKPASQVPLFLEFGGSFGQYANLNSNQTFIFDDGSTTITNVAFSSSMHQIQLGTKVYITSFYKLVRIYATPQIGYNFMNTRVRIDDPLEDPNSGECKPLESRISHRSKGFTYGLKLGIEADIVGLIRGDISKGRLYASVGYIGSFKKFDYINTRYMHEHEHGVFDDGNGNFVDGDGRALTTKFINLSSNDIHEHKIAEIYRTYLRYININIGYVWYF